MGQDRSLLRIGEVATLLRISTDTVRRLVNEGRLPAVRVGKGVRFDREAVLEALPRVTGGGSADGD